MTSENWSGYVAATSLSDPAVGLGDGRQRLLGRPDGVRLIGGHELLRRLGGHRRLQQRDRRADRHVAGCGQRDRRLPGLVGDVLDREAAAGAGHLQHDDPTGRFDHRLGPVPRIGHPRG